jgi:hypothetical protein
LGRETDHNGEFRVIFIVTYDASSRRCLNLDVSIQFVCQYHQCYVALIMIIVQRTMIVSLDRHMYLIGIIDASNHLI